MGINFEYDFAITDSPILITYIHFKAVIDRGPLTKKNILISKYRAKVQFDISNVMISVYYVDIFPVIDIIKSNIANLTYQSAGAHL